MDLPMIHINIDMSQSIWLYSMYSKMLYPLQVALTDMVFLFILLCGICFKMEKNQV